MIYLITFICMLIALALFAGAFYLARHVVSLQHRTHVLEDGYKEATDYIKQQEEAIITLKQELDFIRRTEEEQTKQTRPRSWNPSNIMEMGERR